MKLSFYRARRIHRQCLNFCCILSLYITTSSTGTAHGQSVYFKPTIQALVNTISTENLREHVRALCWADGHRSRVTFTDGNYAAAEYIATYFEHLPGITEVVRDTFYITTASSPWNTYPLINVIAFKEGDHSSDEIVLLGGHYDSSGSRESGYNSQWASRKAQGADDNASGVAAMMEIARILCDPGNQFVHQADIKFIAFAAEEYHPAAPNIHHAGSMWDAYYVHESDEDLTAAVVLDMIAYNSTCDYVEIISNYESLWLADHIRACRDLYSPTLTTNDDYVNVPYSDHESYQFYGFPAILLMENDSPWNDHMPFYRKNPYYHTTADTAGTLNFSLMALVTGVTLAGIADLATTESSAVSESLESGNDAFVQLAAFPNPFNTETTIHFSLANAVHVNVTLFNADGQEVAVLQDDFLDAGSHDLSWNGGTAASGLYFCVFRTGRECRVKKLTLLK